MTAAIEVQELTKRYRELTALDRVTFDVRAGETMGFLGPNGAGKTTALRILAGYFAPTSGRALIDGLDIFTAPLQVKRRIGYLPESGALPLELRVDEFLRYRATLKDVPPRDCRRYAEEAMARCGILDVRRRPIGQLSKGYRQRVSLADALVARPPILILDEPTIGLDPNQILQTRTLIKELGRSTTILLSTHILPEVEMACQRVAIIAHGRIVAVDTPDHLRQHWRTAGLYTVTLEGADAAVLETALASLPGVTGVRLQSHQIPAHRFELTVSPSSDVRKAVFQLATARGWTLQELSVGQTSLEEIFVQLTTQEPPVDA